MIEKTEIIRPVKNVDKDQRTSLIIQDVQHISDRGLADNSFLQLTTTLQSTLEINKLIEIFSEELKAFVEHEGLHYLNRREHLDLLFGKKKRHKLNYNLILMEKKLGQMTLYRSRAFDEEEIRTLESLIAAIIYPLRNSILYKQALEKAYRDPTTGLNNRAALETSLDQELDLAQRHETPLTLIMLDIDHFKQVNDTYGHVAGDAVLRSLAECMEDCIRRSDILYRFGGEEFSILLRNTDIDGANLLAERLRIAVEKMTCQHESESIKVTISLGVASLNTGEDKTALIQRADDALYAAKNAGRNQVILDRTTDKNPDQENK